MLAILIAHSFFLLQSSITLYGFTIIYFFIILFIYFGCAGSSLLPRLLFSCGAQVSHCGAFPCCRGWDPGYSGFRGCGIWAP